MNDFCELFWRLDSSTKTLDKIKALKEYFAIAEPEDAIWAIYFLVGERVKRLVGTKLLRQWAIEQSDISPWMFEECYDRVGDLAETISLVIDATASADVAVTNVVSTNGQHKCGRDAPRHGFQYACHGVPSPHCR